MYDTRKVDPNTRKNNLRNKKKTSSNLFQENVTQNANGRDMSDVVGW